MDRLQADQQLSVDDELTSNNGRVRLLLQSDGNLVLYRTDDERPLWASGTQGRPVDRAVMGGDGNLVLYSAAGMSIWATATAGHPAAWVVLQDDGNCVVYDSTGRPLWASNTVQHFGPAAVPGFLPSTSAPLFGNGPWPSGTALSVSILGLPLVSIDATQMGLCGGMSLLTRDIVERGTPQLRGTDSRKIPLPLAQHLLDRLVQSFNGPPTVARWLSATRQPSEDTLIWGRGLFHQSIDECPGIIRDIDRGLLCPTALVLVQSYAPWDVFQNHVVLVWGYERHGDTLTLRTYDCNYPGDDGITIQLDISAPTPAKPITTNGTCGSVPGQIRGFFRLPYVGADPSPAYIDDASVTIGIPPPVRMPPGATANVRIDALNTGSTTWQPTRDYRLGSQDPQDNSCWGIARADLRPDAVDPQQTATFEFEVTAPPDTGTYAFSWQMLRESVHWFGHPTPNLPIAVGAEAGKCSDLHNQQQALIDQLSQAQAQIQGIDWSTPQSYAGDAATLAAHARTLQAQLTAVEAQQQANGCTPG